MPFSLRKTKVKINHTSPFIIRFQNTFRQQNFLLIYPIRPFHRKNNSNKKEKVENQKNEHFCQKKKQKFRFLNQFLD